MIASEPQACTIMRRGVGGRSDWLDFPNASSISLGT
jgi:hypothetical protein